MIIYLIAGGRDFNDFDLFEKELNKFDKPDKIIEGGANGTDTLARKYANKYNIECTEVKAEWNKYGKQAGFIRNRKMIDMLLKYKEIDMSNTIKVICFWDGKSSGTKNTIDLAKENNIDLEVIYYDYLFDN